ncbi:hypothetical protein EVG20_g10598 [Dentipellis fragilis]|uniref:LsmAD domain-containing protein n=1 Tax=Dentipellis fragilis TaxID=205917 RepID=A0A4Y9XQF4_9AGAM|nr:hypothetical protein EVG20_g10598 [Dentipellis fragilis]
MASVRQPKPSRKGPPNDSGPNRRPAWGSMGRSSPAFSPSPNSARLPNGPPPANSSAAPAFPPLANPVAPRQDAPQDKVLQALTGLTGTTITLTTKTSQRYEGVVASTAGEGDTAGVSLRDVKEISTPGAPLKDQFFIASTNIDTWASGPADAKVPNGDSFKTDTDISHKLQQRRERELTAWADSPLPPSLSPLSPALGTRNLAHSDDITFGTGASTTTSWDQFDANERLFGVKTAFDEDQYTTKLDRTAKDFKEREKRAQVIANEILGATTNNPHIAEERSMNNTDENGTNEEDKYGAVVRGTNAYVPPGARKQPAGGAKAPEIPKVAVNAPDGTAVSQPETGSSSSKAPSPAPTSATNANASKPPADALPAFRDFVTHEKQRLTQKRIAIVKNERDKRMAELVKFSQSFKLNKPIPDDLVTILAKDEDKQRQIREKSNQDAASAQARAIAIAGAAAAAAPSASSKNIAAAQAKAVKGVIPPSASAGNALGLSGPGLGKGGESKGAAPSTNGGAGKRISMFIQPIPAFKGKSSAPQKPTVNTSGQALQAGKGANGGTPVLTPTTANKLNVNASSFKPNPKAVAFTPVSASPNTAVSPSIASASPKPKGESPPTPNPFFGNRVLKKQPVHVKDDFNPFKYNKVAEATAVSAIWPYQGKRYMQMFPPVSLQPQQQSPHMAPPGPPPMPPPSYEEDSAAQAAAATRGYVYAYPPYGYPGQPMMPGMAPPPPGAYMPGPYMQHMPYPPSMPPPNGQWDCIQVPRTLLTPTIQLCTLPHKWRRCHVSTPPSPPGRSI